LASFLGRHSKKERLLPALGVVQTTRSGQLPKNAGSAIIVALVAGRHGGTLARPRLFLK
jgi:hypothetical protein